MCNRGLVFFRVYMAIHKWKESLPPCTVVKGINYRLMHVLAYHCSNLGVFSLGVFKCFNRGSPSSFPCSI